MLGWLVGPTNSCGLLLLLTKRFFCNNASWCKTDFKSVILFEIVFYCTRKHFFDIPFIFKAL